ncbi:transmembrane channel-like protein 7 isoform X1 [Gadus chalcogrammus]|uniref:transmembrane channel-like protein 7 isoform X1 n=2 Tax=Gadus chalcogrammus TaxID=1042646 RepID=UPI0024C48B57|nr:transmembrane channel-like protein 7 isoform X1 [Gadus chalcogrammus]
MLSCYIAYISLRSHVPSGLDRDFRRCVRETIPAPICLHRDGLPRAVKEMNSQLQRQGSATAVQGTGYTSDQGSPRLRRVTSSRPDQNAPQFNWRPASAAQEDAGQEAAVPPKDLRALPMPMALKRAISQVQQMQVPVLSSFQSWKRSKAKSLSRARKSIGGFLHYVTLWRRSLNKIGGNFGDGVQSYFLFLRFLVVLNFLSSMLIIGFVLIPSIVFRSVASNSVTMMDNGTAECRQYDHKPDPLVRYYSYFLDLLSGTGFMEYTYLFYGYYRNTMVAESDFSYNIPLAYLFTAVFYFVFCLICITARAGTAVRVAVATGGGATGSYSRNVFTGWDFGCLGDRATKLKQKNLHYRLQVDLEEERIKNEAASLTLRRKVLLYSSRILLSLVAFGLIIAAFFGIYRATTFSQSKVKETGVLGLFYEYLPSIVITVGNFVVPVLCDQIALLERYNPSITVIVALLRSVFLRMVSLGVLLFTLWSQITCFEGVSEECALCHYNHKSYPCWETRVGQEMYKLTLFDLLITLAMLVLVEFPRRMVVDNSSNKLIQFVGRQEFLVPVNVLGLVYGQTVVWTGALFCPLLPLINTLKFVIVFYAKKITLFSNCRPAAKTFRSTKSKVFFLLVLLFGWSLALVALIYSIAEIHPSMSCGPFRSLTSMWTIVPLSFYSLSLTTQGFLYFIGSQRFSIPLFLFFSVVMCYFIALASVYGKSVDLLKAQLKLEARDKQFLVKQIEELSRTLGVAK